MSQFTLNEEVLSVLENIERTDCLISHAQRDCQEVDILMVTPGDYLAWLEHTAESHAQFYKAEPTQQEASLYVHRVRGYATELRVLGVEPSDKIRKHMEEVKTK